MNVNRCAPSAPLDPRRYARVARDITKQEWSTLGLEQTDFLDTDAASISLELTAERITSVLVVRLVALTAPSNTFSSLSTTCICNTLLCSKNLRAFWPEIVTDTIIRQLRQYVRTILQGYNDVPYHNYEHAYHVFVSANKMLDIILQSRSILPREHVSSDVLRFEEDPLMHLALLFAALIHDVEHQGVPNQQLILENDPLALLYNDQSIAEQRSLAIGFTELRKESYDELREVMFPFTCSNDGYRRFRHAVTDLVLATDISSRERSEIVKQKWQNAFVHGQCEIEPFIPEPKTTKPSVKAKSAANRNTPILKPSTRENRNSNYRKRQFKDRREQTNEVQRSESLNSWMDFNTPSKHFPKDAGASMNDSTLSLWWFCPSSEDGSGDEESCADDLEDGSIHVSNLLNEVNNDEPANRSLDFDASFELFNDRQESTNMAQMNSSYNYPHSSQLFQKSSAVLSGEGYESQHLLSPAKISRLDRIVWRTSTSDTTENYIRNPRTSFSVSRYCNLDKLKLEEQEGIEDHSDETSDEKQKAGRSFVRAFCYRSPLQKLKTDKLATKSSMAKKVMTELRSMLARLRTVDLVSSMATMDETAASSVGESSLDFNTSSSNIKFDPHYDFNDSMQGPSTPFRGLKVYPSLKSRRGALDTTLHSVDEAEDEDRASSSSGEGVDEVWRTNQVDDELITMSLLEHILLVSDVAHTLQKFELMVKFSHRLSLEMDRAIATGRGCGIPVADGSSEADEALLTEWYNNQESFLRGYVMPLAGRLEQTGFLPSFDGTGEVLSDEQNMGMPPYLCFLSRGVLENIRVWKRDGMGVLKSWRGVVSVDAVSPQEAINTTKGNPSLEAFDDSAIRKMLQRRVSTSHTDCIPSRS